MHRSQVVSEQDKIDRMLSDNELAALGRRTPPPVIFRILDLTWLLGFFLADHWFRSIPNPPRGEFIGGPALAFVIVALLWPVLVSLVQLEYVRRGNRWPMLVFPLYRIAMLSFGPAHLFMLCYTPINPQRPYIFGL